MKKIPILLIGLMFLTLFVILGNRYNKNITAIAPFPYLFSEDNALNSEYAPILILGDRMAERLAGFKDLLAKKISKNLSKPIKIATLTETGMGIHRVLNKLKSLERMPLVIIQLQGLDENFEKKFTTKSISDINNNFKLYQNDYLKSLLMVFPEVSKFLYRPVSYTKLGPTIREDKSKYTDSEIQRRNALNFKLYKGHLEELFSFVKKRSAVMIPITTPMNIKSPPIRSCMGSMAESTESSLEELQSFFKNKDYKSAYNISKDLALVNSSNAQVLYLHAKVAEKLNKVAESQKYYNRARAFDCGNQNGSPIYNIILKNSADRFSIKYFDFHQFLLDQSYHNHTFIDEFFPQDFYFEKLTDVLALKIKKLLKL